MLEIKKGNPTEQGMYVCFTDHIYQSKYPEKVLLMWIGGVWGFTGSDQNFRRKVHGWIGPLPAPTIESLNIKHSVKYAISILPDGLHGALQDGPFDSLLEARSVIGDEGQYIFELHLNQESKVVAKWSDKKMRWLKKRK